MLAVTGDGGRGQQHRFAQDVGEPGGELIGLDRTLDVGPDDDELVAGEAGQGVASPQAPLEPAAHHLQQLVARRVPEAVVHPLEVVQVQERHDHVPADAGGPQQRPLEAVHEQVPVRQVGEGVVQAQVGERLLGALGRGDVHVAEHGAGLGQGVDAHAEPALLGR
jgi:hypothetical protein